MSDKQKSKRGGKRVGAGRKSDGKTPRVAISAKVLPRTKKILDYKRGEVSMGKYLDLIVDGYLIER